MGINQVIVFDIDETLVSNEVLPNNLDEILIEINKLKNHHYSFGICTNRPLEPFVKKIADTYLIDDYIICENGAIIYKKNKNHCEKVCAYIQENINEKLINKLKTFLKNNDVTLNLFRQATSTIRTKNEITTKNVIDYLKTNIDLTNYIIEPNNNKILIYNKYIDKIQTLNNLYKNMSVIFVTDYEKKTSSPNKNIKMYSVGKNKEFNKKCQLVFSKATEGILEILRKEGKKYE